MQLSIHYLEEDKYLLDKVEKIAERERRSKSAMMLSILEMYFESGRKLGEILKNMKVINERELEVALDIQGENNSKRKLGEIMVEKEFIAEHQLSRALQVQQALSNGGREVPPE